MNSCFPPLATLNIGDSVNDDKAKKKNTLWSSNSNMRRLSLTKSKDKNMSNNSSNADNASNGKIEVLQDLDLYYIKQIAHNMKVITLILITFRCIVTRFFVFSLSFCRSMYNFPCKCMVHLFLASNIKHELDT